MRLEFWLYIYHLVITFWSLFVVCGHGLCLCGLSPYFVSVGCVLCLCLYRCSMCLVSVAGVSMSVCLALWACHVEVMAVVVCDCHGWWVVLL